MGTAGRGHQSVSPEIPKLTGLAKNQAKTPTCPAYSSESVTSEMLKGSHLFASVIHASRKRA